MKIRFEEIYDHLEDIVVNSGNTPHYDGCLEGTRVFLAEGGYHFIVVNASVRDVAKIVDDVSQNYKQHSLAALKRISLSLNEPGFVFKVDEVTGQVFITDKGTLQQFDNIYKFNWFYGAS